MVRDFLRRGGVVAVTSDLGNRDSRGVVLDRVRLPEITQQSEPLQELYTSTEGTGRWVWWTTKKALSGADTNGNPIDDAAHWAIRKQIADILIANGIDEGPVKAVNMQMSIMVNPMVVDNGALVVHVIDTTCEPEQKEGLVFEIDGLNRTEVSVLSPDWEGTRSVTVTGRNRITIPRDWLDTYLLIVVDNYKK